MDVVGGVGFGVVIVEGFKMKGIREEKQLVSSVGKGGVI